MVLFHANKSSVPTQKTRHHLCARWHVLGWGRDECATLHFTTAGKTPRVIDRISMQPMSYRVTVDQDQPDPVFRNFLEFKIDYRKPLNAIHGSRTLVNNWAASLPPGSESLADVGSTALRDRSDADEWPNLRAVSDMWS